MSTIDRRIVEMQFDNRHFESGVATSLSTIEKLKNALNFENSTKGLDNIGKAADELSSQFDSGRMLRAIEGVSSRFSTMGIIGMTVLQDLTRAALNFAEKFVMAIPRKIANGGWARAMKIETAKFQIEGLGTAWEKVAGDIDYGVAGTAYGLDAAAAVASQLLQSGIEIGGVYEGANQHISTMGKALLAVSGVAGMTSRSYEEIGALFTSVAGAGRVTGDTISRMGMKGLNAAADLTKFFNGVNSGAYEASDSVTEAIKKITKGAQVTETDVRNFVTKKLVDANMFYESMWQLYGEHAKDANNTLTGILANINAAFSKIGADFATPLIQNAIKPLQEIRLKINEVRTLLGYAGSESKGVLKVWQQLAPIISNMAVEMIKGIDLSWMSTFFEGILNIIFDIAMVLKPIQEAFVDIFPPATAEQMQKFAEGFRDLTERFMISREAADNLKSAFRGIFAVFDILIEALKAVFGALDPVGSAFKDIAGSALESAASFGEYLVNLRNTIVENKTFEKAIDKVKNAIKTFCDVVNDKFGPTIDVIKSGFKGLTEKLHIKIFDNLGTEAEGKLNPIKKAFDIFSTIVNRVFESLRDIVPGVLTLVEKLWGGLKKVGSMLAEFFTSGDLGQALKNTTFAYVLYNLEGVVYQASKIAGVVNGLKKGLKDHGIIGLLVGTSTADLKLSFKTFFATATETLQEFQDSISASYYFKIATALLLVAIALKTISGIDSASLANSTVALSAFLGELVGSMELIKKIGNDSDSLKKVGTTMIMMSAAVFILASALKKIADLPINGLLQGLMAVSALLVELTLVALILGNQGKQLPKGASALIIMAIALNILTSAVKKLADMPLDNLVQGLFAVTLMLTELTLVALILGTQGKKMQGGMTGLIAMAAAILILSKAVSSLGSLDLPTLAKGLGGVIVLVAALAGLMVAAKFGKMNIRMGVGILAIAAALVILSKAVSAFGTMDTVDWLQGLAGVAIVLTEIATFAIVIQKLAPTFTLTAIALTIFAAGMNLMTAAIKKLGEMDTLSWLQGLAGVAIILTEVAVFAAVIQRIAPTFILTSVALTVFAGAMVIFAGAIALLGGLSLGTLIKGILGMAVGLTVLGGVAAILGIVSPLILLFGVALGVVGAAVGLVSAGIFLLATAFTALGASLPAVITIVSASIPLIMKNIGDGIVQLITTIGESTPAIITAVTSILMAILTAIKVLVPQIVDTVLTVIEKILESLNAHLPRIVDLIGEAIINILELFTVKLPDFIQAGIDLMLGFINGLADGIRNNTDAAIEAFDNLIDAIIEAAGKWFEHFTGVGGDLIKNVADGIGGMVDTAVDAITDVVEKILKGITDKIDDALQAGKDFAAGFAKGLKDTAGGALDAAKNLGSKALGSLKRSIRSNSPSKETEKTGKDFNAGFTNGIDKNSDKAAKSASGLGDKALGALKKVVGEGVEGAGAAVTEFASRYGLYVNPAIDENTNKVNENTTALNGNKEAVDQNAESNTKAAEAASKNSKAQLQSFDIMSYGKDVVEEYNRRYGAAYEMLEDTTPMEASRKAVEMLALATYEAAKKAEEATNKTTENAKNSAQETKNTFEEIKKDFIELNDGLVQTVQGQMDIFKEWDAKTDLTGEQMLKNMQSQLNGVASWSSKLEELAAKGIDQGLLKKLAEMGPQGYEYVNAFTQMTAEELGKANELFITSLAMPQAATNQILASYAYAGQVAMSSAAQAMINKKSEVDSAAAQTVNGAKDTATKEAGKFDETGKAADEAHAKGLKDNEPIPEQASEQTVAQVILESNKFASEHGGEVGYNLILGIAKGIEDNERIAINAAERAMRHLNDKGVRTPQDMHSPSKVWAGFGRFLDLGLAKGIDDYSDKVVKSAQNTGSSATDVLRNAIANISADDMDNVNPVITPVLDLSQIERGMGSMQSMINSSNSYVASVATRQTGSIYGLGASRLTDAINGINTNNNNGIGSVNITINTQPGQNSREIADMTLNRLNTQIRRRRAAIS